MALQGGHFFAGPDHEPYQGLRHEGHMSDLCRPEYSTDHFRMFVFKVDRCTKRFAHDWRTCPFAHETENARRRDPRAVDYLPIACPDYRHGICLRGEGCCYAHGVYEVYLHPLKYRTQMCKDRTECNRPVCFFAHTPMELRQCGGQESNYAASQNESYSNYSGSPRTPGTGTYSNSKAEAARSFADLDPSSMGGQHSFGQHAMGQHYPGMHKHMNAPPLEDGYNLSQPGRMAYPSSPRNFGMQQQLHSTAQQQAHSTAHQAQQHQSYEGMRSMSPQSRSPNSRPHQEEWRLQGQGQGFREKRPPQIDPMNQYHQGGMQYPSVGGSPRSGNKAGAQPSTPSEDSMLIAAMHSGSGPMGPGSPTQPRVRNSILRQMRMLQLALESGAEPGNKNIPSSLDQPSPTHQPGSPMDQKGVWESVAHLAKQAHYDEQIRDNPNRAFRGMPSENYVATSPKAQAIQTLAGLPQETFNAVVELVQLGNIPPMDPQPGGALSRRQSGIGPMAGLGGSGNMAALGGAGGSQGYLNAQEGDQGVVSQSVIDLLRATSIRREGDNSIQQLETSPSGSSLFSQSPPYP